MKKGLWGQKIWPPTQGGPRANVCLPSGETAQVHCTIQVLTRQIAPPHPALSRAQNKVRPPEAQASAKDMRAETAQVKAWFQL